jgi:antitoxin (DNA-binding transcriptional repressor) of toxin-antitoxin stability system
MSRAASPKTTNRIDGTLARVRQGQRIVLKKGRRAVAAVVSMEDLRLLEKLEDQMDIEIARKRLADPNEVPIPYGRVRKELGLD